MSVVVDPDNGNGRQGTWRENRNKLRLSKVEEQLILHLRMLEAGVQAVRVVKQEDGLREFRVVEVVRLVRNGKIEGEVSDG